MLILLYLKKKVINTGDEMNMLSIEDLIFFKLEINDTYNAEIIGQTENYCLGTDCILPNFKSKIYIIVMIFSVKMN